jgi:heme o synthase
LIKFLKILLELSKIRITIFVALTTLFGYISASGSMSTGVIAPFLGILFLSCGSAILNHWQERNEDAKMDRTKNRPIPSGRISGKNAIISMFVLSIAGVLILLLFTGVLATFLGLLNFLWYNGIYTPLKKKNALAIIPGSVVGALPPMVGWVAAGGFIFDPQIIIIGFFFFIWQIPHFWLLLLVLDKDYQQGGFPTLTSIFSKEQLSRITFIWTFATVVTGLMIPIFGIVQSWLIYLGLFAAAAWVTYNSLRLLKPVEEKTEFRFAFREINMFVVVVVILLSIDKLVVI